MSEAQINKFEKRALYGLLSVLLAVCGYFLLDFKASIKEGNANIRGDVKECSKKIDDMNVVLTATQQKLTDHIIQDNQIHSGK